MKHVSILLTRGDTILSSVLGPFKIFSQVNKILKDNGAETPYYDIQFVGLDSTNRYYGEQFTVEADKLISEVRNTDLVIIPAVMGDIAEAITVNAPFYPWIIDMHNKGSEIASFCLGAFLLGQTGLVDGKKCSTHWMGSNQFRAMYPKVELVSESIVTDDKNICSSGGAYSFLNLLLYLVEKFNGKEIAVLCSKIFEIEFNRSNQGLFSIFIGQKNHEDKAIIRAQDYIERHYEQKITVSELADYVAISPRNFVRRFKRATSNTPIEYIQRVKIEAAKKILESSNLNIKEVMYDVGYTDNKSFRTLFKRHTGFSPLEYKNKYSRISA